MEDKFSLQGKRILITGASSGIGAETARVLSSRGASVYLMGRDIERLKSVIESLSGEGHSYAAFDISSGLGDIQKLVKTYSADFGPFDGLVHAAGVQEPMPIRASTLEHWRRVQSINLDAAFMLIKAFRQRGVSNKPSSVVLLSSVMGRAGQPALTAYSASKAGVEGLVRSAALELASESIRVNALSPGVVITPLVDALSSSVGAESMGKIEVAHPLGFGEAEDVALAASFLLSDAARWVTGTTLTIDGGYLAQ